MNTTSLDLEFNPTSASFLANPYPTYARLRQVAPICFYEGWNKWILTRHQDINKLLRDKRLGRIYHHLLPADQRPELYPDHPHFAAIQTGSLLEIEPPDHTRIRRAVQEVFTPRHIKALAGKIEALCQRLADGLLAHGEHQANLIKAFAEPLPVTVIADLLGIPEEHRDKLVPWSKAIIGRFEPERTPEMEAQANQAAAEFTALARQLMAEKRAHPQDDLISRMVMMHDQNPTQLSEEEIVANSILFLDAGHEATVNVIGNGVLALLRHREQLERLRSDDSLIESAVEEMLRYDTPLQFFERFVLEDMDFQSQHFVKGDKLCLYYAAANHDPEVFEEPEKFDISRSPNPHISFGAGLHFCIGAPLARLELATALRVLLERLPELRLVTAEPKYLPKNVFRYLTELQVAY